MNSRIKEKADSFCSYDLYECRKRKSKIQEVRHQKEAIIATHEWFESKTFPKGTILSLPTGSGKTFTAVRFLSKYPLSHGYKVLWLAHTHHLLEQAFFSFGPGYMDGKAQYEVGWISEPKEKLNIRVVSGSSNHSDVIDIKENDDVVIATLQTIQRAYNNPSKRRKLMEFFNSSDGKLFVVFDEAHHAPAPSYRKMLIGDKSDPKIPESILELFPEMHLLGLTATPTYTDLKKRGWLKDIFPQKIINSDTKRFHCSINDLIFEDILAKPKIIEINTKVDPKIDDRDYQQLVNRHKKDIPERIIQRLANNRERNQIIVNNYDKKRFGKTIIFTDYVDQCEQINTFLKHKNKKLKADEKIRSDMMYSALGDEENEEVLQKFRNDELDVIVNIRMLTEGTDVPDVDSVFLTRQTTSEILLTQMVGRALRGPRFNGTKTANLVFFTDNWKKLINWATWDPDTWEGKGEVDEYHTGPWDLISVALIRKIIRLMGAGGKNKGKYLTYMPLGWYVVDYYDLNENEDNDESEPLKVRDFILVFENDKDNYFNFIKNFTKTSINQYNDDKIKYKDFEKDLEKLKKDYFPESNQNIGKGLKKNIFKIARHMAQHKNNPPKFVPFRDREEYDMDVLARKYMKYDRQVEDRKLKTIYNDDEKLWKTLYYDYDHFKNQYNACVEWLLSQDETVIDDHIDSEEDKLVEIVKTGTSDEKIHALIKLGEKGKDEYLHNGTIDLIYNIIENERDKKIKNAAKATFDIIKRGLTPKQRKNIFQRDGYKCLCCGETRRLQVDHIIPRSLGGSNFPDNLQTLCGKCNGGFKGEEIVDFRKTKTPLKKPLESFHGLGNRYITRQQAERPEFWDKALKRNINLFYRCSAVKKIDHNYLNWKMELNNGNNPKWAEKHLDDLVGEIKSKLTEYNLRPLTSININLTESKYSGNVPDEYQKLWNKYVRNSSLLTDEEKDMMAEYMKDYGLPEN